MDGSRGSKGQVDAWSAALLAGMVVAAGAVAVLLEPTSASSPGLQTFSSREDLATFLEVNGVQGGYHHGAVMDGVAQRNSTVAADTAGAAEGARASDHSQTNVQVAGVDEADVVKNDGKHIYALSEGRVVIVEAYPAASARVLAKLTWDGEHPRTMYLDGDRLVVIGSPGLDGPVHADVAVDRVEPGDGPKLRFPQTFVEVYDVSDPSDPTLAREVRVDGSYEDSRMIGDHVYVLLEAPAVLDDGEPVIPTFHPDQVGFPEIHYVDQYDRGYRYTNVLSIDAHDDAEEVGSETYLLGRSTEVFVSLEHLYVVTPHRLHPEERFDRWVDRVVLPEVPDHADRKVEEIRGSDAPLHERRSQVEDVLDDWTGQGIDDHRQERERQFRREIAREMERSKIHKIALDAGRIMYLASGSVPGRVLNQFSMDEHEGHLRVATTVGHVSRRLGAGPTSSNNVYVLDGDMETVGRLEGTAPGERIYSARFMGDRGYLVTFKKVDPFFVLDLSDPADPEVLGELKLPGYSDYLHPLDGDHVIGIGKDTVAAASGDFAWYQGVKVALFDASDVDDPKVLDDLVIGDRGSDSEVLRDHKAFLLDRDRGFMVLPVLKAELDTSQYPDGEPPPHARGRPVWQGAYVLDVSTDEGLSVRGKVSHVQGGLEDRWDVRSEFVRRSLTMDDTLYTVSENAIEAHDLADLEFVRHVALS